MIYESLPFSEYLAIPAWSWSLIKLLEHQSPRAVIHARFNPGADTASRGLLRAVHALVLEPHAFAASFSVFDGRRAGKVYEAHAEANAGRTILTAKEYSQACATANAIHSHPAAARLLAQGRGEVSFTWTDAATGLPCKGRADWLSSSALVDLKTLGTTNERTVARMVAQSLYHGQLAHYTDGLAANGLPDLPAYIIAAEGKGAQDVAVYEVDAGIPDGALHVGRELRKRLMGRLAECVAANHWPGRHDAAQSLCLPSYALLDSADSITFGDSVAEEAL